MKFFGLLALYAQANGENKFQDVADDIKNVLDITLDNVQKISEKLGSLDLPQIDIPEVTNYKYEAPEIKIPDVANFKYEAPKIEIPSVANYQYNAPDIKIPDVANYKYEAPEIKIPDVANYKFDDSEIKSKTQSTFDHHSGKNPLPKVEEVSETFEDDILEEIYYFDDEDFGQNDERKESSFEFYSFDDLKLLIADFSDKFWK
ncbi:Oidioi.mRNA.OKI2018_I69.chr2.g8193.t1.cds [Oikopleura dioica]|uniref:Oidioi.mRNA.OKI2018_I69.chr2.g8193.t1.cds n=1 Tax=Oikopleura dioica TaxID=34765 RepID=A0ABN7T8Z7_OIKDI|nr:Oidioi.mRNA.OKI2018_I69.chr2.g8193.t1.cds [Oikopleura dioica]